jgi:hypothetical protein
MNRSLTLISMFLIAFVMAGETFAQKQELLSKSKIIGAALKAKDLKTVATFVESKRGLIFAPLVFDFKLQKKFAKAEISGLFNRKQQFYWGKIGEDPDLIVNSTFAKYYDQYVYDNDFVKTNKFSYNSSNIYLNYTGDNPANAIKRRFPKGVFVSLVSDKDADNAALYLVFEKMGSKFYLICVTHITQSEAHYLF